MIDIKIDSEPIFDSFKVLYVIENNKILDEIFRDGDSSLSYAMLRTMAKNNTLNENVLENLSEVFNRIILKNEGPLNEYLSFTDVKIKKHESKLPKHYGKKQILEDIKENDNNKTELDRAMLALNDLRNMYSKLKNRGIKDKKQGTNYLNKEACRDIIASVRIIENKLAHILKKN